jgi:hypothetical protein
VQGTDSHAGKRCNRSCILPPIPPKRLRSYTFRIAKYGTQIVWLSESLIDPEGVESMHSEIEGLDDLLPAKSEVYSIDSILNRVRICLSEVKSGAYGTRGKEEIARNFNPFSIEVRYTFI